MGKKRKIMGLAVLFAMILLPMMGGIMMSLPQGVHNEVGVNPIKTYGLSADPSVGTAAICTNIDDTDNMYGGRYKTYLITANITDSDSAQDIANVTIIFVGSSELASMQWVNTSNVWAEVAGSTYIAGTGVNTTHANDFDVTLSIEIEWAFPDTDDVDITVQVYATDGSEVNDTANVNYDIDTDLTLASTEFITKATEPGGDLMAVNTLTYSYEDSVAGKFPLAAQTDFWVTRSASTAGAVVYAAMSWESTGYVDSTGVATFAAILSKGGGEHTESFNLFAVAQAAGSAGTTLMGSTQTDTVSVEYAGVDPGEDDDIIPALDDLTTEQIIVIIVIGVVGVGVIYYLVKGSSTTKKTYRKKSMKKKRKSKRKR